MSKFKQFQVVYYDENGQEFTAPVTIMEVRAILFLLDQKQAEKSNIKV